MTDEETKNKAELPEEDTDDVLEFVYNEDGEEDIKATLKKLRKDLKEARAKEKEYLNNWQHERADFLNYKKDESAKRAQTLDFAKEQFTEELLPVLDAYDMAFANKEAWEKVDKTWRSGVEYIHQQLLKVLSDNGVSEIAPKEGDSVDHTMHDSIDIVTTDDVSKEHKVAIVMQKGYKMGSRVIRPARVKVWEHKKD